jgi:hypothetical protein
MFSLQQNQKTRGQNRFCQRQWGGVGMGEVVAQTVYTHVNKCKNYKIKERRKEAFVFLGY